MLKSVEDSFDFDGLKSSPYSAKIQALFKTYGNKYSFADFWIQSADTAVCRVDGNLTIECTENSDFDELKQFLNYIPFNTVSIDEKYCECLNLKTSLSSYIVKYNGGFKDEIIRCDDNYRDVYNLLVSCGFELGDYDSYLSDFVSRINSQCAFLVSRYENKKLAATASALFVGKTDALLGAVATDKKFRGKGYATQLVTSLASYYGNEKNVFLFCREDSLADFYKKCGFCVTGRWAQVINGYGNG